VKDNVISRPLGKERILGSENVRVKRRRKGKRGDWTVVNGGRVGWLWEWWIEESA